MNRDKERYYCSCGKNYSRKDNLLRHISKTGCDTKIAKGKKRRPKQRQKELLIQLQKKDEQIKNAKDELVNARDEIAYLRDELSKLHEKLSTNRIGTINNNNNNSINISTGQIKKLLTEYSTGPALQTITDMSQLFDEDDELFLEDLAYDYRRKILHQTIGDCIVAVYKTADPKQQAIWNTDSSRLNYLIKHVIKQGSGNWIIDKKGLQVTAHIITPVLDYLKIKMGSYVPDTNDVKALRMKGNLLGIIKDINDGELAKKINKHIAGHFYMTDNVKKAISYKPKKKAGILGLE